MIYLIGQIAIALLITAGLSGLAGWLFRDLKTKQEDRRREERWRLRLRQSEARVGNFKNLLAEANQTTDLLRNELDQTRRAPRVSDERFAAETATVEALQEELARRDQKIEMLQLQVTQAKSATASEWQSIKAMKSELAERQRRFEAGAKRQSAERSADEQSRKTLAAQLAVLKERYDQQSVEIGTLKRDTSVRLGALSGEVQDREEKLARRDATIARLTEMLELVSDPPEGPVDDPPEELREVAESSRAVAEEAASEVAVSAADASAADVSEALEPIPEPEPEESEDDDLQKIRGIGPVLQRKLAAVGVTSYRQIAAWGDDDIARIATELGAFPGRIQRDRWVESAAALLAEKER